MEIFNFLQGKKSYIVALAMAGLSFAVAMGWIDQEQANKWLFFLGSLLGVTLRAAIGKAEKNGN